MHSRIQPFIFEVPATLNPEITLSGEIDILFNKVRRIGIYTHGKKEDTIDLEIVNTLKVGGRDVYPVGFNTALLFPDLHVEIFRFPEINRAGGTSIEGKLRFAGTPSAPFQVKILLFLENDTDERREHISGS
jgi:hypothetical protein